VALLDREDTRLRHEQEVVDEPVDVVGGHEARPHVVDVDVEEVRQVGAEGS
jgi:hypothetical protein